MEIELLYVEQKSNFYYVKRFFKVLTLLYIINKIIKTFIK
jgi:hypothetical protein